MRVQVHPADEGGCGHYRIRWPAETLAAQGHDVTIAAKIDAIWQDDLLTGKASLVGVADVDADVMVLQRPLAVDIVNLIPHFQAKGIPVVVEIDDDFESIPPANISWTRVHPAGNPKRNWAHLKRACQMADLVVCSTPALAKRYGGHGRVRVVPNFVPERYLGVREFMDRHVPRSPVPTVGWTGSVQTHPGDLEVTRGAVARVIDSTEVKLRIVGTGIGVPERLSYGGNFETTGWVELFDYPGAIAGLDVGIVPLADTAFNAAKSWLKGLEYAAVGVPFVATPTPEYEALHRKGAGLLARRPREWERSLRTLVGSADLRAEMAGHGQAVARELTIEANAWRFMEAWTSARARAAA